MQSSESRGGDLKILLVEDDDMISDAIARSLTKAALPVETVNSLADARHALSLQDPQAIVLDLGLPDGDGLRFLRELRSAERDFPVLVLSARDEPRERVLGLDTGADDYLTKPFDMSELTARLRALMRRQAGRTATLITFGPLILDTAAITVLRDGLPVDLTARQFRLLQFLLEGQGRVYTKSQIIDALYRWDVDVGENTIEVQISQLRKKLWPKLIRTIRGIGYSVPRSEDRLSIDG